MKPVYCTIIETSQIFTQSDRSVVRLTILIPIHASENILVVICSRAVRFQWHCLNAYRRISLEISSSR